MSDVNRYIQTRAQRDTLRAFAEGFETGYATFKIGIVLRQAREAAGLTQEDLARKLRTKKSAISRIENHADDVRLSTLRRYADAMGANLSIRLAFRSCAVKKLPPLHCGEILLEEFLKPVGLSQSELAKAIHGPARGRCKATHRRKTGGRD